jgi:hypothetical protein
MKAWRFSYAVTFLVFLMVLVQSHSAVAARCEVGNVAYSIPHRADPGQRIQTATTVNGSCFSDGEDYYSIRVDVVDIPSSSIVSSNSTPIGYNATNFTSTVENMLTAPSHNGTWHIDVDVYVIRAGGTSGSYLLDYRASSNATIQIGALTPVPEYPAVSILTVAVGFLITVMTLRRRRRTCPSKRQVCES